ncbi:MAG TPA: hypothetical protein VFY68_09340 [Nitrososphaeraceae archaeon]|nr:hypothetical protein [Nitrososphaeraceae archaeon]
MTYAVEIKNADLSNIPGEAAPLKLNTIMTKLRLHKLAKEEAVQFMPQLEKEIKEARIADKREYEKVVGGLTEILKLYLTGAIDLKKPDFETLNELVNLKVSS